MKASCLLILVALASGCRTRALPIQPVGDWTVSATAYGPLAIPSTFATAEPLLRTRFAVAKDTEDAACDYVAASSFPKGVGLMTKFDTIVRIDIDTTGVRTTKGIAVGDSESDVLAAYRANAQVGPSPYSGPEGHDITVSDPGDTLHRIIFQTLKGRVYMYRAGRRPEVDYIEGCS